MRVNVFRAATGHGPVRAEGSASGEWTAAVLLTDPPAPGQVSAGLSNGEVWHSTDHGETWRQLNVSLGRLQRTLLLVPAERNQRMVKTRGVCSSGPFFSRAGVVPQACDLNSWECFLSRGT